MRADKIFAQELGGAWLAWLAAVPAALEALALILGLMAAYLALRGAVMGFVLLATGGTPREVADGIGAATAAGVPSTLVLGAAAGLYVLLEGS